MAAGGSSKSQLAAGGSSKSRLAAGGSSRSRLAAGGTAVVDYITVGGVVGVNCGAAGRQ